MAIPPTSGPYATLPAGRHTATFAEIHDTFVVNAPFPERRQLVFDALQVYSKVMTLEFSAVKLWINGGFVTHKPWAPPKDADVVVVVSPGEYSNMCSVDRFYSYTTLQPVGVVTPMGPAVLPRLQPVASLIDGFIIPDEPAQTLLWNYYWSLVNDENGNLLPDTVRKGYLEVTP